MLELAIQDADSAWVKKTKRLPNQLDETGQQSLWSRLALEPSLHTSGVSARIRVDCFTTTNLKAFNVGRSTGTSYCHIHIDIRMTIDPTD